MTAAQKLNLIGRIIALLGEDDFTHVKVWAHELLRDDDSWSSNDRWIIYEGEDIDDTIDAITSRIEVFEVNYLESGLEIVLSDNWLDDENCHLDINGIPFLDLDFT